MTDPSEPLTVVRSSAGLWTIETMTIIAKTTGANLAGDMETLTSTKEKFATYGQDNKKLGPLGLSF
jgi:hypothetical protein